MRALLTSPGDDADGWRSRRVFSLCCGTRRRLGCPPRSPEADWGAGVKAAGYHRRQPNVRGGGIELHDRRIAPGPPSVTVRADPQHRRRRRTRGAIADRPVPPDTRDCKAVPVSDKVPVVPSQPLKCRRWCEGETSRFQQHNFGSDCAAEGCIVDVRDADPAQ
jgi:hypothetical protein